MEYRHRLFLSEFKRLVEEQFRPSYRVSEYKKDAARIARKGRKQLIGKMKKDADPFWAKWITQVNYGNDIDRETVKIFSEYTIGDLADKDAAEIHAYAFHYRLHRYIRDEDLELAREFDARVTGSRSVQLFEAPVFEYEPDELHHVVLNAPMSVPPYKLKKEVDRRLEENADHGIWLDPHNHHSIPLEGREDEKDRLTAFMENSAKFRICPVIGPSGAGKTRLVSEWMKKYAPNFNSNSEWEAGFLISDGSAQTRDPQPWCDWEIKKNTLIVIDYTHAFDKAFRAIAKKARAQVDHQVRLILIDHVVPSVFNDFLWGGLAGGHQSSIDSFKQNFIEPVIPLESEGDNSKSLRHIIVKSASVGLTLGEISVDDPIVTDALNQLDRMGHGQDDKDAARHPLFAALMGQAIRQSGSGQVDFSRWSRRDLITYYFQSHDRLPWTGWENSNDKQQKIAEGLVVAALVSAATLRRGLPVLDAENVLPKNHIEILQRANRIVSSEYLHKISPLLPDILGEAFLLKFLERIDDETDAYASFSSMLTCSRMQTPVENAQNVYETISRLARNLANDEIASDRDPSGILSIRNWGALCTLLDPTRFAHDKQLRLAMSYSIADVMERISEIIDRLGVQNSDQGYLNDAAFREQLMFQYTAMIQTLELKFSIEDISQAIIDSDFATPIQSLLGYLEFKKSKPSKEELRFLQNASENWFDRFLFPGHLELIAAASGRLNAFRLLWESPSSEFASVKGGIAGRVFLTAIKQGYFNIVEYLQKDGIDVSESLTETGRTAIMIASEYGRLPVVQFLHDKVADLDAKTPLTGRTALIIAAENGHQPVVEFLYYKGANAKAEIKFGTTALMLASGKGHLPVVKFLFQKGSNPNVANDDGETALTYASRNGHLPIVEFLWSCRADANDVQEDGAAALRLASGAGHLQVVEFLYDRGVYINSRSKGSRKTAVNYAIEKGHLAVVEFLYARGADIDVVADQHWPSLMFAMQNGYLEVVKFLHGKKINIDVKSSSGQTAIMTAALHGHLSLLELLHEIGADIHAKTENGWTAFATACDAGQSSVVEWFLKQDSPQINLAGMNGQTPLVRSCGNGHMDVVKLLVSDPRIKIDQQDQNGATALHFSASLGKQESVVALLEAGANPTLLTNDGLSATDCARREAEDIKLAEILKEAVSGWRN